MSVTRGWPRSDLDIAAELRRQLDELTAKNIALAREVAIRDERVAAVERQVAEGNAEREVLRQTLLGEAALAEAQHEPPEKRGPGWWRAACGEATRHRAELMLRVHQLERWCREHGVEATRLQTELTAERDRTGLLTRQLELARMGERCDSREVD